MNVWRSAALLAAGTLSVLAVLGSPSGTRTAALDPRPVATTAAPYLSPALGGAEWSRLPTSRPLVALTFDAGANADGLPAILDTLARSGVPATFFLTGRWVEAFPDNARRIAATPSYGIGNHTYDHPYLTQLADAQVRAEVAQAESLIASTTGRDPHPLFRFPYGDRDTRTLGVVHGLGYGSIRWTVDTLGWQGIAGGQSAASVVSRVMDAAQPGEIVLMHVGSAPDGSTLDATALPDVIAGLRDKGYGFVNLMDVVRELRVDAFGRGVGGAVWHRWWDGTQWTAWESLGGLTPAESSPASASWGYNRLDVFVRGIDDQLWHRAWAGMVWGGWEPLGGILTSAPAVVATTTNHLDVFVRGVDRQLWRKTWTGAGWTSWEPLGGILTSAPAAGASGGTLAVSVRGTDDQLWRKAWSASAWSAWEPLGGILTSAPATVSAALPALGPGTTREPLPVFVRGTDDQLWYYGWHTAAGGWHAMLGWGPVGGTLTAGPAAATRSDSVIDVFIRGQDSGLHHLWLQPAGLGGYTWSSWEPLGGILTSGPSGAA